MKSISFLLVAVVAVGSAIVLLATTSLHTDQITVQAVDHVMGEPIFDGKLPPGYRDWKLISVAREEGNLNDIRAILGNNIAIKAYRDGENAVNGGEGKRPFPDGTIIARLAWSLEASAENNKSFGREQSWVAGAPKNGVQFMIKDSKKYASTGGWGFAQFDDGKPLTDVAKIQNCFDCHAPIKDRDFVFTRYAP